MVLTKEEKKRRRRYEVSKKFKDKILKTNPKYFSEVNKKFKNKILKTNPKYFSEARKKTCKNNPEKYNTKYFSEVNKKTYKNNPEKYNTKYFSEVRKKAYKNNPEKYNTKYFSEANKKFKNKILKTNPKYFSEARKKTCKNNPEKYGKGTLYMLIQYCRTKLYQALNQYTKTGKITSSKNYGIDWNKVVKHLVKIKPKDFEKWNLNNPDNLYSIDHIIPLSSFNLEDKEEIKKAFAPENHQWLKLKDNIIKGNKLDWVKQIC